MKFNEIECLKKTKIELEKGLQYSSPNLTVKLGHVLDAGIIILSGLLQEEIDKLEEKKKI